MVDYNNLYLFCNQPDPVQSGVLVRTDEYLTGAQNISFEQFLGENRNGIIPPPSNTVTLNGLSNALALLTRPCQWCNNLRISPTMWLDPYGYPDFLSAWAGDLGKPPPTFLSKFKNGAWPTACPMFPDLATVGSMAVNLQAGIEELLGPATDGGNLDSSVRKRTSNSALAYGDWVSIDFSYWHQCVRDGNMGGLDMFIYTYEVWQFASSLLSPPPPDGFGIDGPLPSTNFLWFVDAGGFQLERAVLSGTGQRSGFVEPIDWYQIKQPPNPTDPSSVSFPRPNAFLSRFQQGSTAIGQGGFTGKEYQSGLLNGPIGPRVSVLANPENAWEGFSPNMPGVTIATPGHTLATFRLSCRIGDAGTPHRKTTLDEGGPLYTLQLLDLSSFSKWPTISAGIRGPTLWPVEPGQGFVLDAPITFGDLGGIGTITINTPTSSPPGTFPSMAELNFNDTAVLSNSEGSPFAKSGSQAFAGRSWIIFTITVNAGSGWPGGDPAPAGQGFQTLAFNPVTWMNGLATGAPGGFRNGVLMETVGYFLLGGPVQTGLGGTKNYSVPNSHVWPFYLPPAGSRPPAIATGLPANNNAQWTMLNFYENNSELQGLPEGYTTLPIFMTFWPHPGLQRSIGNPVWSEPWAEVTGLYGGPPPPDPGSPLFGPPTGRGLFQFAPSSGPVPTLDLWDPPAGVPPSVPPLPYVASLGDGQFATPFT